MAWAPWLVWLARFALQSSQFSDRAAPRPLPAAREVERWFTDYQRPVLDYLYGMTRDREWAADLTQETFLRAYAAVTRDTSEEITHPQAWLYRIATNVALTALRRRQRFAWLPLSAVEPEAGANESGDTGESGRWRVAIPALQGEDIAATVAERDAVWAALAETPPRWRAALLLQTVGGFTPREIAAELGVSEANARKMLFRAKERFRQIIVRGEAVTAKPGAKGVGR